MDMKLLENITLLEHPSYVSSLILKLAEFCFDARNSKKADGQFDWAAG